jgi:hypothetical protein
MSLLVVLLALLAPGVGADIESRGGLAQGDTPQATAPTIVSYQGRVTVSGVPHNGTGYFKFALVDPAGTTSYWSNDGTSTTGSEPTANVPLSVSAGLFNVLLGDTSLPGMTEPLAASAFSADGRSLRVWFATAAGGPYTLLVPDRPLASAPYALNAEMLDGQDSAAFAPSSHDHWGQSWSGSGTGLTLYGGEMGLTSSGNAYGVSGTSPNIGIYGQAVDSAADTNYGVYGAASNTAANDIGVYGESDDTGIYGSASSSSSGNHYGVYGNATSSILTGAYIGVYGTGNDTGVKGEINTTWTGVHVGVAANVSSPGTSDYGVYALSDNYGVYGLASATTAGNHYGVFGAAAGTNSLNYGVYASSDDTGVYGTSTGTAGIGVYGNSASTGVFGSASGTTYGARYGVYGTSDNTGVYGWATSTTAGNHYGLYGVASGVYSTDYGVYGTSDDTGVYGTGTGTASTGVYGMGIEGVYGYGTSTGVHGRSTSTGVYGESVGTSNPTGVYGTSLGTGVYGRGFRGVYGRTTDIDGYGVLGETSASYGFAVRGDATNASGSGIGVYGSGPAFGVYSDGNFAASGYKAAIVETQDYGWRHLYAMESPDNWFEDFGQAQLVDGKATVAIEPVFAQTVNLSQPYHVFLTPMGDCPLYVAEKTPTSFTVRAHGGQTCSVAFDYRIIAKRLGYEDLRLGPAQDPATTGAPDRVPGENP